MKDAAKTPRRLAGAANRVAQRILSSRFGLVLGRLLSLVMLPGRGGRGAERRFAENLAVERARAGELFDAMGFVPWQNAPAMQALRYGRTTLAKAGCEAIAVYHVLRALQILAVAPDRQPRGGSGGQPVTLSRVAFVCEQVGALEAGGFLGSDPYRLPKVLKRFGLAAAFLPKAGQNGSAPGQEAAAGALIVTFWNERERIFGMMHTVALVRQNGGWQPLNNGPEPVWPTLSDFWAGHSDCAPVTALAVGR